MAQTRTVGGETGTPSSGPQEGSTGSTVESAKESAKSVAETSAEQTRAVAHEAKAATRDLVGETRGQLRNQAQEQTSRVAAGLRGLSSQLEEMSSRSSGSGTATEVVRQAADRSQQMAQRLEDGGLDGLVDDARRLARNRPGTFLLAAAGAGFLIGRVVRAADTRSLAQAAKPSHDEPGPSGREDWGNGGSRPQTGTGSSAGVGRPPSTTSVGTPAPGSAAPPIGTSAPAVDPIAPPIGTTAPGAIPPGDAWPESSLGSPGSEARP
jgi:hypothetical protein